MNPNPINNITGDCVIRAISIVKGRTWDDIFIDLMLKTDDFISEICYACGFNNISNFNRFFKKKIGMTPSEYRIHIKTSMKK